MGIPPWDIRLFSPSTILRPHSARLYISHFIQVLNLAVIRSEVRIAHKEYYGLDTSNNNVPDLSTEPALAEWGRKIVDGENEKYTDGQSLH